MSAVVGCGKKYDIRGKIRTVSAPPCNQSQGHCHPVCGHREEMHKRPCNQPATITQHPQWMLNETFAFGGTAAACSLFFISPVLAVLVGTLMDWSLSTGWEMACMQQCVIQKVGQASIGNDVGQRGGTLLGTLFPSELAGWPQGQQPNFFGARPLAVVN